MASPTERLVPLVPEDRRAFIDTVDMLLCFQLNEHLTTSRIAELQESLFDVLRRPGLDKLAARIRRGDNGQLYHVFDPSVRSKPALFSSRSFDQSLSEHPVSKSLPRPHDSVTFEDQFADKFRDLFVSPAAPIYLAEHIKRKAPMVCVHISAFRDAALVGVKVQHVVADAAATAFLVTSWLGSNRRAVVPCGVSPLDDLGEGKMPGDDERIGNTTVLTKKEFRGLVWQFMKRSIIRGKTVRRGIYVPGSVLTKLREQSNAELSNVWVSDYDLVTAWLLKLLRTHEPPARPFALQLAIATRKRVPQLSGEEF